MWSKPKYCGQLQNHVRIANFSGENRKTSIPSKSSYFFMVYCAKCVERYCELANKTTQQLYKVSTLCIDDHHFEEMKSVGELSNTCSQIDLKCLYLARFGRHDILWSVNKLALSITKWTKACDTRLNRLISYIHHTCEYRQYCHLGNTAKQCRLGLFQDSDFAGDLEDSKSTSGGTLCIFGSHTFVPISWMCKKQTSDSNSSTESEITLWILDWDQMDCLLWNYGILLFLFLEACLKFQIRQPVNVDVQRINNLKGRTMWWRILILFPQTFSPRVKKLYLLSVFEDNEAVIKMIIKGRSPTMRHVSRTDRFTIDPDSWWILLPGRRRSYRLQLQWARWRNITEIKIHGNQLLEKIDQGNLVRKQRACLVFSRVESFGHDSRSIRETW